MDEESLVRVDKSRNAGMQPVDHNLGEEFHWAVLQRDWAEGICSSCPFFFRQEDEVCSVEAI
jgi:hypothetical protein